MPEHIRWGILGNATIARVCVIPAIQNSRNGRVTVMASRHPDAAKSVQEAFSIPELAPDYEAVLETPRVDAVYIPLPNHLHLPWTLSALAAGKHVLCEKPLALSAGEARKMVDAAAESGRFLMEAFMYRFHPRMQIVRDRIQDGVIGSPVAMRTAFCYRMAAPLLEKKRNFRLRPETGGGALLDVGCYGVSLSRWLMNAEPDRVQAQAICDATGVDLHLSGLLGFDDRALATVEASFISALQQTFTVTGTRGAIELPHNAFVPWRKPAEFILREADQETGERITVPGADEYQLMVEAFADAVLGRTPLPFLPEDSVRNMKVLDALALAARNQTAERPLSDR